MITIRASGQNSEFIDLSARDDGESYMFEMQPAGNGNYNIVDFIFCEYSNYIVPVEVYDNALVLAKEHPVVNKFILDHDPPPIGTYFRGWYDALKVTGTPNPKILDAFDFPQPVRGIVYLHMRSDS